jgi:perosamine synthetase
MKIPLCRPFLGTEERDAVLKIIENRSIASGETTGTLEDALAIKFHRKHCVVVNSGTTALYLSLKTLGIKKVIFPSLTCNEVLWAILNAGCEPIFADIEPETHNIDMFSLSEKQLREADSIIVTQAYGHSADMNVLEQYMKKYQLTLVENFAQATGGYFQKRILGSFGKVSITSFYATKNLSTGQGGAILTDDSKIYQECLYARGGRSDEYYSDIVPLHLRMTDIQAAIGLVQLKNLDRMVNMRREIAQKLTMLLSRLGLKLPVEKPGIKHTYYKYHLVLPEYIQKQEFIKEMGKEGVSVGVLLEPPLHNTLLAKNMLNTDISLPVSEEMAAKTISLPMFPEMTDSDISQVNRAVHKVLGKIQDVK